MKRERTLLISLLIILLNIAFVSASVMINEVMPNPTKCSNDACEYIEIYTDTHRNLTNWLIDTGGQHVIIDAYIEDYLVITKNKISFIQNWSEVSEDKIIEWSGIGLANSDTVSIFDNSSNLVSNITYVNAKEDKSLQLCNNSWIEEIPTPGTANNCSSQQTLTMPSQEIHAEIPQSAFNNNTIFKMNITFANFTNSTYDLKVGIQDSGNNTAGEVYLDNWISSYYYATVFLKNKTDTNLNYTLNDVQARINSAFVGNATIQITVRNSTSQSIVNKSAIYTIKILNGTSNPQNTINTTQNCMLEIIYAPEQAYFGSTIDINISVYRNNTGKYAVYLYIEDNEGKDVTDTIAFHADNKSTNYTFNASLEIDKECNITNKTFAIMLEGLDEKINKSITLKENTTLCLPDFEYKITPVTTARINETFSTRVRIINNKNTDTEFDVWSYVYRGTKCYSCVIGREENKQHIIVNAKTSAEFLLDNTVSDAEPGDYSLKVKILKGNTATEREYTFPILLEAAEQATELLSTQSTLESNLNAGVINTTNNTATGKTIYESETEFNKMRAEIIFISTLMLATLYFLLRPKIIAIREHGV